MRQAAIKCLPDLCKNNSNKELCTKVADVLTQLLVSGNIIIIIIIILSLYVEDPGDVVLVKSAMSAILLHDTPSKGRGEGRGGCGAVMIILLELPSDVVMTTTHWHTLSTTPTEL